MQYVSVGTISFGHTGEYFGFMYEFDVSGVLVMFLLYLSTLSITILNR